MTLTVASVPDICIYIYVCVCVCVCVQLSGTLKRNKRGTLGRCEENTKTVVFKKVPF